MSDVDLSMPPWDRLIKLAPPGSSTQDLQRVANLWNTTADVYAAAADLWEEFALAIDIYADDTPAPGAEREVSKVSQDGITVEYASDALAGNGRSTKIARQQQALNRVRELRKRSKPYSPLMHSRDYNPWHNNGYGDEEETIIVVDGV